MTNIIHACRFIPRALVQDLKPEGVKEIMNLHAQDAKDELTFQANRHGLKSFTIREVNEDGLTSFRRVSDHEEEGIEIRWILLTEEEIKPLTYQMALTTTDDHFKLSIGQRLIITRIDRMTGEVFFTEE